MKRGQILLLAMAVTAGCAHGGANTKGGPASADPLVSATPQELLAEGKRQREAGDLVRAEQYLSSALKRSNGDRETFDALIGVCLAGSRYQTALAHTQAQLVRQPQDPRLHYLAATLFFAIGDLDRARDELERLIQEADTGRKAQSHYLLALTYLEPGDPGTSRGDDTSAARTHLRRYLELAPTGKDAADATYKLRRLGSK